MSANMTAASQSCIVAPEKELARMKLRGIPQFFAIILVCLVWGLVVLSPRALRASDSKTAEAQALLGKTEQLSGLAVKGAAPFRFEATVEYVGRPQSAQSERAAFVLLWASEDRWRASAESGENHEVHIHDADRMWQPKLPNSTLQSVFGDAMIFPFQRSLVRWDEKVGGLLERKIDGKKLSCVQLHSQKLNRELCINPSTGLLERRSYRTVIEGDLRSIPVIDTVVEYRDYVKFGEKWVPQEIRTTSEGPMKRRVRVASLSFAPAMPDELFTTPPGYEAWQECERHDYVQLSPMVLQGVSLTALASKVADAVFVIVASDGKAQEVRLINPTGRDPKEYVKLFMHARYRPATCDGKPVLGYLFMRLPLLR